MAAKAKKRVKKSSASKVVSGMKDKTDTSSKNVQEASSRTKVDFGNIVGDAKQFFQEVKVEFFRVAWPDKKMTLGLAGMVIALTAVISMYLGSVDFILGKIVSYVL